MECVQEGGMSAEFTIVVAIMVLAVLSLPSALSAIRACLSREVASLAVLSPGERARFAEELSRRNGKVC